MKHQEKVKPLKLSVDLKPPEHMSEIARLKVQLECERLLSLFYYWEDYGEAAKTADLFTEDATVTIHPDMGTWKGRETIRKGQKLLEGVTAQGTLLVHQFTNFLLTSISKTEATGTAFFTMYKSSGKAGQGTPGHGYVARLDQPAVVGETRDRFVKTRDGWRIAEHHIIFIFDAAPSHEDPRREAYYKELSKFATAAARKH